MISLITPTTLITLTTLIGDQNDDENDDIFDYKPEGDISGFFDDDDDVHDHRNLDELEDGSQILFVLVSLFILNLLISVAVECGDISER